MLYGKIYREGDMIVFEASAACVEHHCYRFGRSIVLPNTAEVAIGRQALAALVKMLNFANEKFIYCRTVGDFGFTCSPRRREGEGGALTFVPREGETRTEIAVDGEIRVDGTCGFSLLCLYTMPTYDDSFLRTLDLPAPASDGTAGGADGEKA